MTKYKNFFFILWLDQHPSRSAKNFFPNKNIRNFSRVIFFNFMFGLEKCARYPYFTLLVMSGICDLRLEWQPFVNYLIIKYGQLINTVLGNIFRRNFVWFWGLGPQSRSFIKSQPNAVNQKPFMMNLWFFIIDSVYWDNQNFLNIINEKLADQNYHTSLSDS